MNKLAGLATAIAVQTSIPTNNQAKKAFGKTGFETINYNR